MTLSTLYPALRALGELYARIEAAQRCAYAAELGRRPSARDRRALGLDARSVARILDA